MPFHTKQPRLSPRGQKSQKSQKSQKASKAQASKPLQTSFAFRPGRGGKRAGSGRKPTRPEGPGVSHARRPLLASRFPVHVSLKLRAGLPSLRDLALRKLVFKCLRQSQVRQGFRLVHFSIQCRHLHLLVEAPNARALSTGIQGLSIRLAKQLNKTLGISGKVFADRYYEHVLKTPTETRNALAYVLNNSRRHSAQRGEKLAWGWIDPLSSGPRFDGWKDAPSISVARSRPRPPPVEEGEDGRDEPRAGGTFDKCDFEHELTSDLEHELTSDLEHDEEQVGAAPKTWLLRTGWKYRGLLSINDVPGGAGTRKSKAA